MTTLSQDRRSKAWYYPWGTPELSGHKRRQLPEPCNHIPNQNTPSSHLCHKEVSKALVIHLKKPLLHVRRLRAKQSCSFNLRSTSVKLLRAFLPQHQVLQSKEGKSQSVLGGCECAKTKLEETQERSDFSSSKALSASALADQHAILHWMNRKVF